MRYFVNVLYGKTDHFPLLQRGIEGDFFNAT